MEFLAVRVWKFTARLGANVINHAVILRIEKGTRHALQHIVVVFINPEILVDELLRLLSEMFRNALNIGGREKRTRGFAAVGALQAIGAFEFGVMQFLHHIIDVFGRLLFELVEILFVFVMLIFGKLFKLVYLWIRQFVYWIIDAANLRNK